MTITLKNDVLSVAAADDFTPAAMRYKAVTFGGTIAAAYTRAAGILVSSVKSGETASVAYHGITKAYAAAAVSTIGFPLKITTSGFLTVAASGDPTIGRALTTAASGDLIPVAINFLQQSILALAP